MHVWIVVGVWAAALLFSVIVLGFATYEIVWKAQRLDRDRTRLTALVADLLAVSEQLQAAAERGRTLRARVPE